MQLIGLMGYVDKYDFLINMAKVLEIMNKSTFVIDATNEKKLKYVLPAIDATSKSYITNYNNVDFALGFNNFFELEEYMRENDVDIAKYDYVLIDIDSAESYKRFCGKEFYKKYMFIDSNLLSVAKNKELVKAMRENMLGDEIKFTKIYYKAYLSRASENYLESQISLYNVFWQDESYAITLEEQDRLVSIDSQLSGIIQVRKHTKLYIMVIANIVATLIGDDPKNVIKQIKRRKN